MRAMHFDTVKTELFRFSGGVSISEHHVVDFS